MRCLVCGTTEAPMVFANDPWCCDDHRKVIAGEKQPTMKELRTMDQGLLNELTSKGVIN